MANIELQRDYALSLIETSCYNHEMRSSIESFILSESNPEVLHKAINKLKDNQLDRISSGLNYGVKHISEHLNKIIKQ